MGFNNEEQLILEAAKENIRQNQQEIIEVVTARFSINNVNFNKSIAVVTGNKLLISIVYGEDLHFTKNLDVSSDEAQTIIQDTTRKMAENMRDVMERYRQLCKNAR